MGNARLKYGASITYRPIAAELVGNEPDSRPIDQLPSLILGAEATPRARDESLTDAMIRLNGQGYRIEAVERVDDCRTTAPREGTN